MKSLRFYRLKRPELPWGDYGDMLAHGMGSRSESGKLELERSGPFIPPISQPGNHVVVTASFLSELQSSGLKGIEVSTVTKKRIPKIDWRAWKPYGKEKMKYPAGNEPENYILRRTHSEEAAVALGKIFELRFKPGMDVSRDGGFHLVRESWNESDFFAIGELGTFNWNYVSEGARDWLLKHAGEWVAFEEEKVK